MFQKFANEMWPDGNHFVLVIGENGKHLVMLQVEVSLNFDEHMLDLRYIN